jgi:hypothetical protein
MVILVMELLGLAVPDEMGQMVRLELLWLTDRAEQVLVAQGTVVMVVVMEPME